MKAPHRLVLAASCTMILASAFSTTACAASPTASNFWRTLYANAQNNGVVGGEEWSLVNLVRTLIPYVTGDTTALAWADLSDEGKNYALYMEEGRLLARHEEGFQLWETEPIAARHIRAIRDLDKNGAEEIIVEDENGLLHIINGRNGHSLLTLDTPGRFWIRDLGGETSTLFLFQEESESPTLTAYHFPAEDTAEERWTRTDLSRAPHVRISGEGETSQIHFQNTVKALRILQTSTGEEVETRGRPLPHMSSSCNLVTPLFGGENRTAILSFEDEENYPKLTIANSGNGSVLFSAFLEGEQRPPADLTPILYAAENSMLDLDGDGAQELLFSILTPDAGAIEDRSGEDVHELQIRDLTQGQVVASQKGLQLRGTLEVYGQTLILAHRPEEKSLEFWSFDGQELQQVWSMPHADILTADPSSLCNHKAPHLLGPLLQGDLDDDGAPEYILERNPGGNGRILQSLTFLSGVPEILGQRPLSPGQRLKTPTRHNGFFEDPQHMAASFGEGELVELGPELETIRTLARAERTPAISRFMPIPVGKNEFFDDQINLVAETQGGRILILSSDPHAEQKTLWESSEEAWFSGVFLEASDGMLFVVGEEIGGQKHLTAVDGLGQTRWTLSLGDDPEWPRDLAYIKPEGTGEIFLYRRGGASPSIESVRSETGEPLHSLALLEISGASDESTLRVLRTHIPEEGISTPAMLLIHAEDAFHLEIQSNGRFSLGPSLPLGSRAYQSVANSAGTLLAIHREDGGRGVYDLETESYLWQLEDSAINAPHPPVWAGQDSPSVAFVGPYGDLSIYNTHTGERILALCANNGELTAIPPDLPVNADTCNAAPLQRVISIEMTTGGIAGAYHAVDVAGNLYRITHYYGTEENPEELWTHKALSSAEGLELPTSGFLTGPFASGHRQDQNNRFSFFSVSDTGHAQVFQIAEPPVQNIIDHLPGQDTEDIDLLDDASELEFSWDAVEMSYPLFVFTSEGDMVPPERGTFRIRDLKPGVRYSAAITPLSQTPALTDGAMLRDDAPPQIALTPDLETSVFSSRDLTSYNVQMDLKDQGTLRITRASLFHEDSSDPLQTWVFPGLRLTEQEELLSWPLTTAAEGEYMLFVTAEDFARQRTTESLAFEIDNTAPAAPEWVSPSQGSNREPGTLSLEGNAEPNTTIQIRQGFEDLCTTTALNTGAFACDVTLDASETAYTFTATATDDANNQSAPSSLTFQVLQTTTNPNNPTNPSTPDNPTNPDEDDHNGRSRSYKDSSCTVSGDLAQRGSGNTWWISGLLMALFVWRRRQ